MTIDLHDYITNQMKMSHIYQPVMLKVLLENNGEASIEQIASALLSYDQSQVEYYGIIITFLRSSFERFNLVKSQVTVRAVPSR